MQCSRNRHERLCLPSDRCTRLTPEATSFPLEVLLVDDDEGVRETTASMLQVLGMSVRHAASGPEALAQIEAAVPDLLVLDYAMPGMNGAELARHLRARGVTAPMLMITGYADLDDVRASLGPEAKVLQKPFQLIDLGSAIMSTGVVAKVAQSP